MAFSGNEGPNSTGGVAESGPRSTNESADRGRSPGRHLHASRRGWVDAERAARSRRSRRLRRTAVVVAGLVLFLAWGGIAGGPGATPVAAVRVTLPHSHRVPSSDPPLPWPTTG